MNFYTLRSALIDFKIGTFQICKSGIIMRRESHKVKVMKAY